MGQSVLPIALCWASYKYSVLGNYDNTADAMDIGMGGSTSQSATEEVEKVLLSLLDDSSKKLFKSLLWFPSSLKGKAKS